MEDELFRQISIPDYKPIEIDTPIQHMWAEDQFEVIKEYIERFERNVDNEHEVGVQFTNFGQSIIMQVTNISFRDPVLLIFEGFVSGRESILIQHTN